MSPWGSAYPIAREQLLWGIACRAAPRLNPEGLWALCGDGATEQLSALCSPHATRGCQGLWLWDRGLGAAWQSPAMAGCQICHPVPSPASGYCPTMVGLQILRQPQPCHLAEGDTLVLECRAMGNPPPQYQWFRNQCPLEGAQTPQLQVRQDPGVVPHGTARHGTARHGTV